MVEKYKAMLNLSFQVVDIAMPIYHPPAQQLSRTVPYSDYDAVQEPLL
jgi:hypothetical protein